MDRRRQEIGELAGQERPGLRKKIRVGLQLFAAITVVTLLVILILTVRKETLAALKKVQPVFLGLTLLLWSIYLLFDGLRVQVLSGALGRKVDMSTALQVILSGHFLAAVTPFQTGGFPVQLWLLRRRDVSIGKGSLILLFRGVLELFLFLLAIPLIWIFYGSLLSGGIVRVLFRYLLCVYLGYTVFLLLLVFLPRRLKRVLYGLAFSLRRRGMVRTKRLLRGIRKLFREVDEFRQGLRTYFVRRKLRLLGALSMTLVSFVAYFGFAPMLLYGLGIRSSIAKVVVLQILLKYLLFFMPTPGASGVAEVGFASLFYQVCPEHLLGIYVILWRFFTFYLAAGVGGITVLKLLRTRDSKARVE